MEGMVIMKAVQNTLILNVILLVDEDAREEGGA